ncbi:MAG: sulfite exporter TauE/SafE family protein [Myxococcales bacterium]
MTPLLFSLVVLASSFAAGVLGSLLGLGGGVVVIPVLTLALGVDIRLAIAASAIAVVATSSSGATENVRSGLANLRLAAFLELGAAAGALTGALLSGVVAPRTLYVVFGVMLAVSGLVLLRKAHPPAAPEALAEATPEAAALDPGGLRLGGVSVDDDGRRFAYRVHRPGLGLALIYLAGLFGGMLGVGAGVLKVPALDLAMKVPWRASTATSALMIGVTAAASAGVFLGRGDVAPIVAAPVAVGVVLGAQAGSRLARRMPSWATRSLFFVVVAYVSVQMLRRGLA